MDRYACVSVDGKFMGGSVLIWGVGGKLMDGSV